MSILKKFLNLFNSILNKNSFLIENNTNFKKLTQTLTPKNISPDLIELIFLYSVAYRQDNKLLKYIKHPSLKFNINSKTGNIINHIKNVGFNENFIKKILNIKLNSGGKGIGFGETILVLFFNGEKIKIGDVKINNKCIELKANGGRLSQGKGKGREGNISFLFKKLQNNYPKAQYKINLIDYIHEIITLYPESESIINLELNKIYPKTENYIINKTSTNEDLLIKYAASYINSQPDIDLYMFINDDGDYNLYESNEMLYAIKNKHIIFRNNITPSSSYPQLKLN